jgi:hypothetical protein
MSQPHVGYDQTVQPPQPKKRNTKSIVLTILAALLIFGIGIGVGTVSGSSQAQLNCRAGHVKQAPG